MPTPFSSAFATKRLLPVAEWMAENAYIPPGLHRLLAASGLAVGLWGGRSFMDIVVARDHVTGETIQRDHVPQLFRPTHGIMTYNPYADAAADRWKSVVDKFVPAVTGGIMAYYGGKMFFHGKAPDFLGGKALHPLSELVKNKYAAGEISSQIAEHMTAIHRGTAYRAVAAGTYEFGATLGTDKLGGFIPGTHNTWATNFAGNAGILPRFPVPSIPGVRQVFNFINQTLSGNYSHGSISGIRVSNHLMKFVEAGLSERLHDVHVWADEATLTRYAHDLMQNFPERSAEDVQRVAKQLRHFIDETAATVKTWQAEGHSVSSKQKELFELLGGNKKQAGLQLGGLDKLMDNAGVNISPQRYGRGWQNVLPRALPGKWSSLEKETEVLRARKAYIDQEIASGNFKHATSYEVESPKLSPKNMALFWGGTAGSFAATLGIGSIAAHRINKRAARVNEVDGHTTIETSQYAPPDAASQNSILGWINGTPLDVAQWASRMVIVTPSMHRLMSAAYLSAALYGGMKLADAMTGRKLPLLRSGPLANSVLERKDAWLPFRPLHGIMKYTPGSTLAADRWKMAAHYLIPVTFGAAGTYTGSALYLKDRFKKLETPETLEDFADKIAMEQSKPFAWLTAITSIFNTGSGIHLLPVFNYSSNLQSRYVLGAGLQVCTPGLGKWWSGNEGLSPWGIKKTLAYVGNMLGKNPAYRPRELPALVHSVLAKLYPDMPETELLLKKREFLHAIYEVRDAYFVEGVVPPSKRAELATRMEQLVTGHGFETLLSTAGFDMTRINLASNGASGAIANALGKRGKVKELEQEFQLKFAERIAKEPVRSPRDYLRQLAEHSGEAGMSANDNHAVANDNTAKPARFTDKVLSRQTQLATELG